MKTTETNEIVFKGGIEVQFLKDTPDLNTFKCIVLTGARTPMPHYHEQFDETVYGLKGVTTVTLNGKKVNVNPGESVLIPRGSVHEIANQSKETIEFLCEIRPGSFGYTYFREIEPVVNADGPPDIDKLKAIMKNHGLVPVLGFKHILVFAVIRLIRKLKKY